MIALHILAWYQNPKKHLILAQFGNSPWTGMQGWCLPEGSLIFENDHRPFAFGVSFRFG
jgi:hypothetical protein